MKTEVLVEMPDGYYALTENMLKWHPTWREASKICLMDLEASGGPPACTEEPLPDELFEQRWAELRQRYRNGGWASILQDAHREECKRQRQAACARLKEEQYTPEFQHTEPLENFAAKKRTVADGTICFTEFGQLAPVRTPWGVDTVYMNGIRRKDGKVQFGIGKTAVDPKALSPKHRKILNWVSGAVFYDEWPD